jgi:phosphatidate cytidylyltransferase
MDDQRGSRPDKPRGDHAEGVRIIRPDEAAEAAERDDVAPRRSDDELRFGDRPPAPPAGPRPALRFPLDADADPTRIERPPVEPAPDPVTGPVALPHWTEPPTGEVPAVLIGDDAPLLSDDEDDLDAWSSFATSTPRWRDADDDWGDDEFVEQLAADSGEVRMGALGGAEHDLSHDEYFGFEDMDERVEERTGDVVPAASWDDDWSAADAGTWTDEVGDHADPAYDDPYGAEHPDAGYGGDDGGYGPPPGGRNMPAAIGVGVGLAAVGVVALTIGGWATTALVTIILALCAIEYFEVLRKVGWESARLVGLVACVALPLAVYWRGPAAYALIGFLLVATVLAWYLVGAGGVDPRVLEGSSATILGVAWIGGLGSSATAMARIPDGIALVLIAILAAVAYDVGGLFIGRAIGHRPLSHASPNKTVEGLLGGMACALLITIIGVGILGLGPWDGVAGGLLLGLGAAVAAPLGDLCQSVLKRDLGVKDMGALLPGHGGVLDRFDSMLFVLPTVLWLTAAFGTVAVF